MNSIRCRQCKHFIIANAGEGKIYGCDRSKCVFEPTTKNDLGVDCISREQALVAIRNLYPSMPRVDFNGSLRKWVDKYKPYIECDDAIKQLPSVTPQEPKTGHWNDIPKYENIAWLCSECGHFTTMKHNFCPNCGARMVEPQESEDKE